MNISLDGADVSNVTIRSPRICRTPNSRTYRPDRIDTGRSVL